MEIYKRRCVCVSLALLFLASSASRLLADRWDIQVAYGGWSLSPFTTAVEQKSEEMIREEYFRLLHPLLEDRGFTRNIFQVDMGSSGKHLALGAWYNFGQGRFSLGLHGRYFHYRIPYDIYSRQIITFLGYPMAEFETQGSGKVSLGSVIVSLLGRYKVLDADKLAVFLYGGVSVMPFDGKFKVKGNTALVTPIGDFEYQGAEEYFIKEIRKWDERVPSSILSPAAGCSLQYKLSREIGLILDAALSHGAVYSAGIAFMV